MSPDDKMAASVVDLSAQEMLLQQIAALGARPFLHQVVQSPWHPVIDAESLHREVKHRIRGLIDDCSQPDAIRCLTIAGPAGFGKTHLLAWTRQLLDQRDDAVFIYVSPYLPGSPGTESLEQHVMRATLDALWLRSRRQQSSFEQAVRSMLVGSYDSIIESGEGIKETLRAGTFWSRLFRRSSLRIGKLGPQGQLVALQRAFTRRTFFERAFADFAQRNPSPIDGARADWDAFVAACLLTCGDGRQRWHADRWFRGDRLPPDVLEPFHLCHPCQGSEKIRNGLFTLNALLNRLFCFAFDQMEDTSLALQQLGQTGVQFGDMMATLLRNLTVIPRFCLVFTFQQSVWLDFAPKAPPMLTGRMTEGYGAQLLRPLDEATAQELIRRRLGVSVWSQLASEAAPKEDPYFPFALEDIRRMRIDTGGELRAFLLRAQQRFEQLLQNPLASPSRPHIKLTGIEPREVISHEPTAVLITGQNFPEEVQILFGSQPAPQAPICRPAEGEIDVTTPVDMVGDIEVRVQAADDPANFACVPLCFVTRPVPRPYCQHIDPLKLKVRRTELKFTQAQVAEKVGSLQPYLSQLETGKWKKAPDDLYVRLAELYQKPLSAFVK